MATLLCRRCNQSTESELNPESPRARCPTCSLPMVAVVPKDAPQVVPLRNRKTSAPQPERQRRRPASLRLGLGIGVLALVLGAAGGAWSLISDRYRTRAGRAVPTLPVASPSVATAQPAPAVRFEAGEEATIVSEEPTWVWFAAEKAVRPDVAQARRAHDLSTLEVLAGRGKAFRDSIGARVVIKSAEADGYWTRIRQGINQGRIGWIGGDYLARKETSKATSAAPVEAPAFHRGELIELIGTKGDEVLLASDLPALERLRAGEKPGPRSGIFAVAVATRAEVREVGPEAIRVRLDDLFRNGREGWISAAEVRPFPTEDEMLADLVEDLGQSERRQIYLAARAIELDIAARIATGVIDEAATRTEARAEIARRYEISLDQLSRIEAEGARRRWPSASRR